LPGGWFTIG